MTWLTGHLATSRLETLFNEVGINPADASISGSPTESSQYSPL